MSIVAITTSFSTFSQSAGCSPTPTALAVNSSCVNSSFANNDNGTSQTVNASCAGGYGTAYEDVWYSVTGTGNTITITMSGTNRDGVLAAFTGCGTGELACATVNSGGTGSISFPTTSGTTYYIQIQRRSGSNTNNMSGNICAVSAPSGPSNDDPCSATPLTVSASCSFSTYTNASATASSGVTAPGCANYSGGDVWFTITVPASGNVAVDMNTGVITDAGMAIYSGSCGSLALVECDDDDSANGLMAFIELTGQTPGATLWVRVWEYGNDNNGTFDICAYEPVVAPPPANDDCSGAYAVTVNASSCTSTTAGTIDGATASSQDATACGGTENDDVWFSFVAPATGSVNVSLLNVSGSTTDLYHSVWEGTCPSLTLFGSSCSDPNTSSVTGLTPGNTYYLRVYSYSSTTGQTTTFDVCLVAGTVCGGANNNDYCQSPAILTQGPGSWTSTTYAYYTDDPPTNYGGASFCGSVENNSWYQFTALSSTETFDFTSVTNCSSNWGVQAEVYDVTTDINGCCTSLSSVSNCWNPGVNTTGTVTATGLTIGNTYVLMVDGWGGDNCEFTVSNWTATGILPVELVNFNAIAGANQNIVFWQTETEYNNDYFRVLRSYDAENYEVIGIVDGKGNSSIQTSYQFNDTETRPGDVYYKLEQVDNDGTTTESEAISLYRKPMNKGLLGAYPNPANEVVVIELFDENGVNGNLQLLSMTGQVMYSEALKINGLVKKELNVSQFAGGVYNLVLTQEDQQQMIRLIIE